MDEDPVVVPEVQEEGLKVEVEQCVEETELDWEPLTVPFNVGLIDGVVEILAVLHTVIVTLPVRDTDIVGLKELVVHPDTVTVEQALGVFVTVTVPV